MDKVLSVVLVLAAFVFVVLGAGWLIVPAVVAPQLGMPLLEAEGLSTQIGDLASFFLTLGGCILIAQFSGNHFWFYPPIMLLGLAAFGRVIAWLFHSAALTYEMIAVEAAVVALLVFALRRSAVPGTGRAS